MVFWRNRSEKKAETPASVEADVAVANSAAEKQKPAEPETATNVVTLVTSRLADRLADVSIVGTSGIASELKKSKVLARAETNEDAGFAGQQRAVAKIRAALSSNTADPLLIFGEPGLGRKASAKALASEVKRKQADEWVYVVGHDVPSRAKALAISPGEGARFVRDVRAAIEKAATVFDRYVKSDEHRINLDLLEEEARYRSEKAVEHVRRRAEDQNIAVVKSIDGYVLAPMHEGRVVRSDVFRALPEALKRNVEAKITALEDELQGIVATLPEADIEANDKYETLLRQTALRAVGPPFAALKASFADSAAAVAALTTIEDTFLAAAVKGELSAQKTAFLIDVGAHVADAPDDDVVFATNVSVGALFGEIGPDASGRLTLIPGYLARARSGTIIIEAWKLAADPQAWSALSSALASREFAPLSAPGLAIKADTIPLSATVVLIADAQSWSKLEGIEPGVGRHFPHVAKFAESAPLAELDEEDFGRLIARIGAENGFKPVDEAVVQLLHKDAVRRGAGRVSLSEIPLLQLLRVADATASTRAHKEIRVSDLNEAIAQRADGNTP